jgi:hypothetical protein
VGRNCGRNGDAEESIYKGGKKEKEEKEKMITNFYCSQVAWHLNFITIFYALVHNIKD